MAAATPETTDARETRKAGMTLPAATLREMQEVGRDLYHLALVTSHGGNLSIRAGHDMWITGTNTMLGHLHDRHISFVRPDGSHEGPPRRSRCVGHMPSTRTRTSWSADPK